jgi:hypothetical protein
MPPRGVPRRVSTVSLVQRFDLRSNWAGVISSKWTPRHCGRASYAKEKNHQYQLFQFLRSTKVY